MKKQFTIFKGISIGRLLSIALMWICLTFLTSLNFLLYPSAPQPALISLTATHTDDDASDKDYPSSAAPTEEKSGGSGFSIIEEILHENHLEVTFASMHKLFQHLVAEADKIEMVHTELISPPPKA